MLPEQPAEIADVLISDGPADVPQLCRRVGEQPSRLLQTGAGHVFEHRFPGLQLKILAEIRRVHMDLLGDFFHRNRASQVPADPVLGRFNRLGRGPGPRLLQRRHGPPDHPQRQQLQLLQVHRFPRLPQRRFGPRGPGRFPARFKQGGLYQKQHIFRNFADSRWGGIPADMLEQLPAHRLRLGGIGLSDRPLHPLQQRREKAARLFPASLAAAVVDASVRKHPVPPFQQAVLHGGKRLPLRVRQQIQIADRLRE